jgi:hypothetical protein
MTDAERLAVLERQMALVLRALRGEFQRLPNADQSVANTDHFTRLWNEASTVETEE